MADPKTPGPGDLGTMRELEERMRVGLAVLERKNRKLRNEVRILTVGFGLMVALLGLVAVGSALQGDGPAMLDVRRLRIVDAQGIARGEWTVDDNGSSRLSVLDMRGRPRLNLSVLQNGYPGLALVNEAGQRRAVLGSLPDQTTTLVFADGQGVPRAVLGLTGADAANLVFAGSDGISRMGMGLDGRGVGSLMVPPDSAMAPQLPESPGLPGGGR
jgi:hypothetical protein